MTCGFCDTVRKLIDNFWLLPNKQKTKPCVKFASVGKQFLTVYYLQSKANLSHDENNLFNLCYVFYLFSKTCKQYLWSVHVFTDDQSIVFGNVSDKGEDTLFEKMVMSIP